MKTYEELAAEACQAIGHKVQPTDRPAEECGVVNLVLEAIGLRELLESKEELHQLQSVMCAPEHDRWRIVHIENQRMAEQRDEARAIARQLAKVAVIGHITQGTAGWWARKGVMDEFEALDWADV